jgi:dipeptidyl-peptidase-4
VASRAGIALALLAATLPLRIFASDFTLERIYGSSDRLPWMNSASSGGHVWLDDDRVIWPARDERGTIAAWMVHDDRTATTRRLLETASLERLLTGVDGFDRASARAAAQSSTLQFDGRARRLLIAGGRDLHLIDVAGLTSTRLTRSPSIEEEPTFSPDGSSIAFLRGNDLFVLRLADRVERRLTVDGSEAILNGKLDYVYQEEVFGREVFRGYWWSPDSRSIAFLRLDESKVPVVRLVDETSEGAPVPTFHYPRAGDPNPVAELRLADVTSGAITRVVDGYDEETLIVDVSWRTDSSAVVYQVQDRVQRWLDLRSAERRGGRSRRILREATAAWVEPWGPPLWLRDGSFLWLSERSGWRHLYRVSADGSTVRQLTRGPWEVRALHGVDGAERRFFFSATERSPRGLDVYSMALAGSNLLRLSERPGTHHASFNPSRTKFVDYWSDVSTPHHATLVTATGGPRATLHKPEWRSLSALGLRTPELFRVKARDGFPMEAMLFRPRSFDASKRYPIFQFVYGAPRVQEVRDEWRGHHNLFFQLLAERGIVVFVLDNRTASGKGAVSAWPAYLEPGRSELADLEDGVVWLKQQPWADTSRLMMYGWSYGGFLTAYALTHSDSWTAGIIGAPVADWRTYDSIYSERLLLTPRQNPQGYRRSSPRFDVAALNEPVLLVHGSADDNVHPQNTTQLAAALRELGKPFEMKMYPNQRHTFDDDEQIHHLRRLMLDFAIRHLAP